MNTTKLSGSPENISHAKKNTLSRFLVVGVSFTVAAILLTSCFASSSKADTLNSWKIDITYAEKSHKIKNKKEAPLATAVSTKKANKKKSSKTVPQSPAPAVVLWATNTSETLSFTSALDKPTPAGYERVWGKENMSLTSSGGIKVFFPAWSYSPENSPILGGGGFIYSIGKTLDSANISFNVMFDKNFKFNKGGKFGFGFCTGTCPTGWAPVGDDFSTRFMWRTNGDIEVYGYVPTKTEAYGQSFGRWSFRFTTGKYYKVSQTIKLNTPGVNDGVIVIYVDDKEVFRDSAVTFRKADTTHITKVIFSNFFGWNDATWATPVNTNVNFNNVVLTPQ